MQAVRAGLLGVLVFAALVSAGHAQPGADRARSDDDMSDADVARVAGASWTVPTDLLRRAIRIAGERRICAATDGLAQVVDDVDRDALTRALAAAAMGEIACRQRRGRRVEGLSGAAVASLENATAVGTRAALRQAATRALGRARASTARPTLEALRTDADPIVRYVAAQSLTRITGQDWFDAPLRDQAVLDLLDQATAYTIGDDPAWTSEAVGGEP